MVMAAIYARVSSARQKEEQTIASQSAALRSYAAANGLEVPTEWVFEDDGHSGATLIRPALERLRDVAAEVEVPVLLCYAPDRLARRYVYQTLLIEEFARVGTEVRFLKGRRSETAEDELLVQFQGMIAEYERAQIAERTRRGKLYRARSGSTAVLSGAPYGYRYVRKDETADARYEIVEPEATVVRQLFARYIEEQESIAGLVRWLRTQEIPTATGKLRWDRSTVWGMLRNPAYCGRAAFGKTGTTGEHPKVTRALRRRGARISTNLVSRDRPRDKWIEIPVPPIISEEMFALAARRLEDNKRFASRRAKIPSLLQGLVVCQSCGYSIQLLSNLDADSNAYPVLLSLLGI
jgi:site-specific DNA recombinase